MCHSVSFHCEPPVSPHASLTFHSCHCSLGQHLSRATGGSSCDEAIHFPRCTCSPPARLARNLVRAIKIVAWNRMDGAQDRDKNLVHQPRYSHRTATVQQSRLDQLNKHQLLSLISIHTSHCAGERERERDDFIWNMFHMERLLRLKHKLIY